MQSILGCTKELETAACTKLGQKKGPKEPAELLRLLKVRMRDEG